MDAVISEVRCCLESGNYRAALVLALIIPDIYGLIEHPECRKESKKRYVAWFNDHILVSYAKKFTPEGGVSESYFDGDMCYSLRCKLLHEGNNQIDVKSINASGDKGCRFELRLIVGGSDSYGRAIYSVPGCETVVVRQVTLNITDLCEALCSGAEDFCRTRNKDDFNNRQLNYVDLSKMTGSLNVGH
ncbi:hypothetical protein [Actinomyces oris]|uniref:hypothetical protein n=1 Tax=Actinomyces oris TaxID=544580 RepID=UPI0028528A4C|nr:hypothetical protein [Actinomyces oris]